LGGWICRRVDCLVLSYLEVLQAAPLRQLSMPALAAAVREGTLSIDDFDSLEPEPQCDQLAPMFLVPSIEPLLLAFGGLAALLAGAKQLLVSIGKLETCMCVVERAQADCTCRMPARKTNCLHCPSLVAACAG
jgi:hypothetical protein